MRSRRGTRPPAWLSPVVVLVLCYVAMEGNCGGAGGELEVGSGVEDKEWWLENLTNGTNFTELCTGMIDINSSEPIYSNYTAGNYSHCK